MSAAELTWIRASRPRRRYGLDDDADPRHTPGAVSGRTAGLLKSAWEDWDALIARLSSPDQLLHREPGRSSVGWALAHVSNQLDGWINVRFQAQEPDPLLGLTKFSIGGSGVSADAAELLPAVERVRRRAWTFLERFPEDQLDETIPYDGSIIHLRHTGLSLRHALFRLASHHYVHLGEAASELGRRGLTPPQLPGPMSATIKVNWNADPA